MKMHNILKYIGNLGIRSKLMIGYLAAFVLFFLVSGLIIHPIMKKTIEKNIESELNNTTKTILNMVKTTADASIKNYLRAVAEKNKNIVEALYLQYRQGVLSEQEAMQRAISVLMSQRIGETGYIYCLDSRGIIRVHPVAALRGADLTKYDFIHEQLKKKDGYIEYDWKNPGELITRPKALYMTYFKPWDWIISASSYREEFTQLINIDFFSKSILSIRFGKTGYPYILDSRGNVIIHPVLKGNVYNVKDSRGNEFVKDMIRKRNGKIIYTWRNPDEKEYREKLVIFNYIPEFDWLVASSSYVEEFYEPLSNIRIIIMAIIVSSLCFLFLLTFMYSSYIVKNLNALINSFRTSSGGDYSMRMSRVSEDEFGRLSDYFNDFMEKLDRYHRSLQQEIQDRKRAEENLKTSLEEKETLLRELYHRTKNTMQVIRSILFLQAAKYPANDQLQKLVGDTENRIMAMSLVHEKLYQSHDLSWINMQEYIEDLMGLIMKSYEFMQQRVSLKLDVEPVKVLMDTAIPCGLILNELLTNALKHAFPGGRRGVITVRFFRNGSNNLELDVSDDGVGVQDGFSYREQKTLGLQSIIALSEHQLQGRVFFSGDNGVACRIKFTDTLYTERV